MVAFLEDISIELAFENQDVTGEWNIQKLKK